MGICNDAFKDCVRGDKFRDGDVGGGRRGTKAGTSTLSPAGRQDSADRSAISGRVARFGSLLRSCYKY